MTAELDLMVHGGVLQLPTAGAIDWPDGDGPVRLVTGPGRFSVTGPDRTITVDLTRPATGGPARPGGWRPARWVDLDGWRICSTTPIPTGTVTGGRSWPA